MLILAGLLICVVGFAFLFFRRFKKNRKMGIAFISLLSLFVLSILMVKTDKGFVLFPMGMRRLIYLAMPPDDLYKPIVTDSFLFYEKGFAKTCPLQFKYLVPYNIGFLVQDSNLPSKYKFNGKVRAEFYQNGNFLFGTESTSLISASYADNDMEYFRDVCLFRIETPLQGKYKDNISVRLTVLEPDESLRQYGESIKLSIRAGSLE